MNSQFSLFKRGGFLAFFTAQFLGAYNDNFAKSLYGVLLAYGLWDLAGARPELLVSLAAAVFIFPFILFTPFAGFLADRYDKTKIIIWTKIAELLIVFVAITALYTHSLPLAFFSLFALGTQTAFFSPCKFSILPQHIEDNELIAGNALIGAGTYIAVLMGTMIGAFIAPLAWGNALGALILLAVALIGIFSAFRMKAAPASDMAKDVGLSFFNHYFSVWKIIFKQRLLVIMSIFATSWFYFFAAGFHAQFPNFTSQTLGADPHVLSLLMVIFSVGIALGGLLNHSLLKGENDIRFVCFAALAIAFLGGDLYWASVHFPKLAEGAMYEPLGFFTNIYGLRVTFDLVCMAIAAGVLIIPLRSVVQAYTALEVRARVVSGSNMLDAIFILLSAIIAMVMFSFDYKVEHFYIFVSSFTGVVGVMVFIGLKLCAMANGTKGDR